MNKLRTIDAALIHVVAAQVEINLNAIAVHETALQHELNMLHEELKYADPVKYKLFEKFMYHLVRYIAQLQASDDLMELVKAMTRTPANPDVIVRRFYDNTMVASVVVPPGFAEALRPGEQEVAHA
jgi:hypothetical protein